MELLARIPRYTRLRDVGAGGSGSVHLVEDRCFRGAPVALKVLRIGAGDDESLQQQLRASVEREFAVLANVAVPRVARVLDFGSVVGDDGARCVYFTRAFVPGETALSLLGSCSLARAAQIVRDVAVTLAPLHRQGLVHADLKLSNVVLDSTGAPHLIDFGLADLAQRAASGHGLLGAEGVAEARGGTPGYVAPEVMAGERVTPRSDVFALGVCLQGLVLGRLFEHTATRLRSKEERAVLEVARHAMNFDPYARPASADEFALALERAIALTERLPTVFVPPRPRGFDSTLQSTTARMDVAIRQHQPIVVAVRGSRGSGKTTFLTQLKWRLQLAYHSVIEGRGAASGSIHDQVRIQLGADDSNSQPLDSIRAAARGGSVLVIDDMHLASESEWNALATVRNLDGQRVAAVVTVDAGSHIPPWVDVVLDVPALSESDVLAICRDALGPIDQSATQALTSRAGGSPAALISLLHQAWSLPAVSAQSVEALTVSTTGALVLQRLSERARKLIAILVARDVGECASADDTTFSVSRLEDKSLVCVMDSLEVSAAPSLEELVRNGLASKDLQLEPGVGDQFCRDYPDLVAEAARAWLARSASTTEPESELTLGHRAILSLDPTSIRTFVPRAAEVLESRGERAPAIRMLEALLVHALPPDRAATSARLARLLLDAGDTTRAGAVATSGLKGEKGASSAATDQIGDDALIAELSWIAARCAVRANRLDDASRYIDTALLNPGSHRAELVKERARISLRRGDAEGAAKYARESIESDSSDSESLAILGLAESYLGNLGSADQHLSAALEQARRSRRPHEEATAHLYRATHAHRQGALEVARASYQAAIHALRSIGDAAGVATASSNLGVLAFHQGAYASAVENLEVASRLAAGLGNVAYALSAKGNLAVVLSQLGSYERAKTLAEQVLADAVRDGHTQARDLARTALANCDASEGAIDRALSSYSELARGYEEAGRIPEAVEAVLDGVDVLLSRGEPGDVSAAAPQLVRAKELESKGFDIGDQRVRRRSLAAAARARTGDLRGALAELDSILSEALPIDLEWRAHAERARIASHLGEQSIASDSLLRAQMILASLSRDLPRDLATAFATDARRRAVLQMTVRPEPPSASVGVNESLRRVLDLINRIARERDVQRVLERVVEVAVDLSGAERGILLISEGGHLVARAETPRSEEPFSRSIAEAVLIDGEPIVTYDAGDDRRLRDYTSVHRLSLRSVACFPVRATRGALGVLYLEHRGTKGQFARGDLDVLMSFADQAAIAIENAELHAEASRTKQELVRANFELERTRNDLETLVTQRRTDVVRPRRADAQTTDATQDLIGGSEAMQRVRSLIGRVASVSVPVLIVGENGVGKELVARAVHDSGPRRKGPFVAVNCGAVPDGLIESELFGHVRGAFTGAERHRRGVFAAANGGTLFLDELLSMTPKMQVELLRVLQDGTIRPVGSDVDERVDVRVVAAAGRTVADAVAEGTFREDLYYRLSVVEIRVPPLRDRIDDLPALVDHFLAKHANKQGTERLRVAREALARLATHAWPGNVRELEHQIAQAAVFSDGRIIRADAIRLLQRESSEASGAHPSRSLRKAEERKRIVEALEANGWNRGKAAEVLGMPRRTFYRRLDEFGLLE